MTSALAVTFEEIHEILSLPCPEEKCAATASVWERARRSGMAHRPAGPVRPISAPGRPEQPVLVAPQQVPRRRLGSPAGRVALVHAVAHIEFNAINLALDAAYRFRGMPAAYYLDWLSVAADEARHYAMLAGRLRSMGSAYGAFPAHNGLWEMAEATAGSCLERMALVPRVLEARGLDVTPGMIERLAEVGDTETVALLEVILAEEVRHVEIGTRWFHHCCAEAGVDPDRTFLELLRTRFEGRVRGPFNLDARDRAGFSKREMQALQAQ